VAAGARAPAAPRVMDRRRFVVAALASVAGAPRSGVAQAPTPTLAPGLRRIGFLGAADPTGYASRIAALRAGLRDHGYVEGRNLVIEFRWADGRYDRLPALAGELARADVEVIVTHAVPPTLAAKRATATIPIVMTNVGDAVANGIVASLAHPGGNVTGDTFFAPELAVKRLELVRDALPRARSVAVLVNPDNAGSVRWLSAAEAAAPKLQLALVRFDLRDAAALPALAAEMAARRADALVVNEDARFIVDRTAIADAALAQRLPTVGFNEFAEAGGLVGYGVDFLALYRGAAGFVDRILKGAKPADLPVVQPTKFSLVVNRETMRRLGLTLPPALLARADVVA